MFVLKLGLAKRGCCLLMNGLVLDANEVLSLKGRGFFFIDNCAPFFLGMASMLDLFSIIFKKARCL